MAERVRVRDIASEEGTRLLRIVRRSSESVVTWRRTQMVLLPAQGMDLAQIARVRAPARIGCAMCSTASTPMGLPRCARSTPAAGRRSSLPSAATCALCIRPRCASRSSWTA